jgi:hypothetical protein
MIKKTLLSLAAVLSIGMLQAQTVDQVIDKHLQAIGGKEKLSSIQSISWFGNIDNGGVKIPYRNFVMHNTASRYDVTYAGMQMYGIVNKDSGFTLNPFQGGTKPEAMTKESIQNNKNELDLQSNLNNYKAKGYTAELREKEDVDGVEAYTIKLVINPSKTIYYYIDPSTWYIIRQRVKSIENGQEFESATTFYDFKALPDGLVFPFIIDNITYDKIEVNTTIDPALFKVK